MKYSMSYLRFSLLAGVFVASFSFAGAEHSFPSEESGRMRVRHVQSQWGDGASAENDGFISAEEQECADLEAMRQFRLEQERRSRQNSWVKNRGVSSAEVSASLRRQGFATYSTPVVTDLPLSLFLPYRRAEDGLWLENLRQEISQRQEVRSHQGQKDQREKKKIEPSVQEKSLSQTSTLRKRRSMEDPIPLSHRRKME